MGVDATLSPSPRVGVSLHVCVLVSHKDTGQIGSGLPNDLIMIAPVETSTPKRAPLAGAGWESGPHHTYFRAGW